MNIHAIIRWIAKPCGNGCGKFSRFANAVFIILLLSTILPAKAARAQEPSPLSYTYQECAQVEEVDLRDELNRITQSVFDEEQGDLDVAAIVQRNWEALNLDATVDAAVDAATDQVSGDVGYWSRVNSLWSTEKAEELAKKVAHRAFSSPAFRDTFDQLSLEIADDLVAEIRLMTVKSASSALLCVQDFVGYTFSPTMVSVLEEQIQRRVNEMSSVTDVDFDYIDIATMNQKLFNGVGVIIGTQVARVVAQKMAGSIAGKIVVRLLGKGLISLIPLAGWVIGAGLIVYDLFSFGKGALPHIQESLQGADVKAEIRARIVEELNTTLRAELAPLARSIADEVFSKWQDFRLKYKRVLDLAETNSRFRTILDYSTVDEVYKLSELVAVADATLQPGELNETIDAGQFERILALPLPAYEILRVGEEGDPNLVIAWADLAGEGAIVQVVETELYLHAAPSEFRERVELEEVLALQDSEAIQTVMQLNQGERDVLLGLATEQVRSLLLADLPAEELSWLATYLPELPPQTPERLVDYVVREPGLISELRGSEDLRAKFSRVLTLAQTNPRFKTILNSSTPDQAEKLSELVAVVDQTLEPEHLTGIIDTGQFERILALPQQAFDILRIDGDPELVIAWADLSGAAIVEVVETELYRVAWPAKFSGREELGRVLALQDPASIQQLMLLNQGERDVFLELPTELARSALIAMSAEELSWLAAYLLGLLPNERKIEVDRILREPALLPNLRFRDLRNALRESPNAQKTLEVLEAKTRDASPAEKVEEDSDLEPASPDGPIAIVLLIFVCLMSLRIWWQSFHRRRTATNRAVNRTSRVSKRRDRP